jgi:hypothetical protein
MQLVKDRKTWNDVVQTTTSYVGMWSQFKKIQYSKKMTITAAQTTYFKSAATESKLFHVSDGVYGRYTRISSRIILQYIPAATVQQPGTKTKIPRINKCNYILFACFPSENAHC